MKMQSYMMRDLFTHIQDLLKPDLVTRELGTQAYELLRQELLQINSATILVFCFTDVLVMDSSFAGPSLLRLMRELVEDHYGERYVALSDASSSTEENVNLTILGHGLKLAVPVIDEDADVRLLGQIEPSLSDSFEVISQRKTLTARELADLENIGISAASNRLKKLYDLHLISRIEEMTTEGRQHKYQSLTI